MDIEQQPEGADATDSLTESAQLFARGFTGLNQVFGCSGTVRVVSEEQDRTLAVGVRATQGSEEVDVDCVLLEPNQESLRDCLDVLFESE